MDELDPHVSVCDPHVCSVIVRKLGKMTKPKRNYARIDTLELKTLLLRNVGHQRADRYFDLLTRLFSLKITKSEFDRFCIRTIGRKNIYLHNRLLRAILKNSFLAKVPPLRGSARVGSGSLAGQSALLPKGKANSVASEEFISKGQEQQSATELYSLGSRPPVSVEEGEEVEQTARSPCIQSRSPVTAPLGISLNFGCGRKNLTSVSVCSKYYLETCQSSGHLPDTRSLRTRLQQKLGKVGLSATVDCVNLLNNALDAYLKRLIETSVGLSGSSLGNEDLRQNRLLVHGSNVLLPGRHMQIATKSAAAAAASLVDFHLAMELNPPVLGPDWPIHLEKICLRAPEE